MIQYQYRFLKTPIYLSNYLFTTRVSRYVTNILRGFHNSTGLRTISQSGGLTWIFETVRDPSEFHYYGVYCHISTGIWPDSRRRPSTSRTGPDRAPTGCRRHTSAPSLMKEGIARHPTSARPVTGGAHSMLCNAPVT